MAIAGIILAAKWLVEIKRRSNVGCRLCKKAQEQRGASTAGGDVCIRSTFCGEMATIVTAAHNFIRIHLYANMQAAQTRRSKLRFLAPETESSNSVQICCGRRKIFPMWQEKEFEQICTKDSLTGKAQEIAKKISVKDHRRGCHDFDPISLKSFLESVAGWRSDEHELSKTSHPGVYTVV